MDATHNRSGAPKAPSNTTSFSHSPPNPTEPAPISFQPKSSEANASVSYPSHPLPSEPSISTTIPAASNPSEPGPSRVDTKNPLSPNISVRYVEIAQRQEEKNTPPSTPSKRITSPRSAKTQAKDALRQILSPQRRGIEKNRNNNKTHVVSSSALSSSQEVHIDSATNLKKPIAILPHSIPT